MTQVADRIAPTPEQGFDVSIQTLIIGAGACGLVAALAAREVGQEVMVLERDAVPSGSTALSAGLIPAAGTRFQRAAEINDTPTTFAADIMRKAENEPDPRMVDFLTGQSAGTIEWLTDAFGLPFSLVTDFDYPGHKRRRMHGLPTRSGRELMDCLRAVCEDRQIDLVCECPVETLYAGPDQQITGVAARRPDGTLERIGCGRLILACNGFGGNADMVRAEMPEIGEALYFGHAGNQGDAVEWGRALGAACRHLGAFQGHGNVAHPHGILITWAVVTEGGFQVNTNGARFWNEAQGYSEAAQAVLSQPDAAAVTIFDERIAAIARQFADFREAEAQSAVRRADSLSALAGIFDLPPVAVCEAAEVLSSGGTDPFGRDLTGVSALHPPYYGVRVTGALFHTQGGLEVDTDARVKRAEGGTFPNLFAAGGAACGVSGSGDSGYLSGNGLLSAIVLGRQAGMAR